MKDFALAARAGLLALAFSAAAAVADWAPPGPIKMLIAFKAGGGADTQARLIAEELEARHGWKIIPEQLTGKGGANLTSATSSALNAATFVPRRLRVGAPKHALGAASVDPLKHAMNVWRALAKGQNSKASPSRKTALAAAV